MNIALSKFRKRFRRTLRLTLAWVLIAGFTAMFEFLALSAQGVERPFPTILEQHTLRALIGGLVIGGLYVFTLHDMLRKWPLLRALLLMTALLGTGTVLVVGLQARSFAALADWQVLGAFMHWSALLGGSIVMFRLNDRFGGGDPDYLLDRWRKPRQQLRIFMFLDMRSSTSIAETLGDVRYFQLLNDIYADITDPVVYSEGDIYQYVGDEISVSWKLERGARNERCIRCYFAIREKLLSRAAHYTTKYGIAPVFKAGLHFGPVTSGQVGLVKRQTIFSGDVVNTAAHIQASCNALGVDILVSKDLLDVLVLSPSKYKVRPMGSIPLKGKRNAMELFTLSLPSTDRD